MKSDAKKMEIGKLTQKMSRMQPKAALPLYHYLDTKYASEKELRMYAYLSYGPNLVNNGLIERSKEIRFQGLKWAKELNNHVMIHDFYHLISSHYVNTTVVDSATFYVNEAEKIALENPEDLGPMLWQVYQRKGDIQYILGNSDLKSMYYEKAWVEMSKYPEHHARGFLLYLITDHFNEVKDHVKQAHYAEMLIEYYKAKELKTPDYHFPVESVLLEANTPEGISHLKKVIAASDSLNNYNAYSTSASVLAQAMIDRGTPEEAIPIMERTIERLEKVNYLIGHSREKALLTKLYEAAGDYKKAYEALKNQKVMEDSIRTSEMLSRIADYEVRYDTERKVRELDKQAAAQKLLYLILGSIAVVLSILTFYFVRNRKKNKLLAQQKKLLESTLDEKNVLLKETHHRVKNSFQIVSSLLYLQSENIEDQEAQLAIREAQNRVRSMVLIHQKLYNKDQLVGIDTKEYFSDLTKDIFESHHSQKNEMSYELNVQPMVLDIETITPVGLILNELITNVLKHAFVETKTSQKMHIDFGREGDHLILKVSDNGKGMPEKIRESSFGIKLMRALAKKLKATLNFSQSVPHGTVATLSISRFKVL